jgi:hypothetical protein
VRYVGKVYAAGRPYHVYFDIDSDPDTEAHRGHSDVVITSASGHFLGLYDIDTTEPVRTQGADILFGTDARSNPGKRAGYRIHFGPNGPPREVYVGDQFPFSTPAAFPKDYPNLQPWPELGPDVAKYCQRK